MSATSRTQSIFLGQNRLVWARRDLLSVELSANSWCALPKQLLMESQNQPLIALPNQALNHSIEMITSKDVVAEANKRLHCPAVLVKMVYKSPVLSQRLLDRVNSSSFGLKRRVSTINEVVVVIGPNSFRHLVLVTLGQRVRPGIGL
jgi:hypothetical protein